jgi:DNA invertase Pin-like site-specific DNA recombinase
MTSRNLGYARVSTTHQTLDRQKDALNAQGVERIWDDKLSGVKSDRPGLTALLDYAREGDTITVVSLDRLGRSTLQVLSTVKELQERKIALRCIKEDINPDTAQGQFMLAVFAAMGALELAMIQERGAEAREAARSRGKSVGRPRALTDDQERKAKALRAAGESLTSIAETLGCSRATAHRVTRNAVPA